MDKGNITLKKKIDRNMVCAFVTFAYLQCCQILFWIIIFYGMDLIKNVLMGATRYERYQTRWPWKDKNWHYLKNVGRSATSRIVYALKINENDHFLFSFSFCYKGIFSLRKNHEKQSVSFKFSIFRFPR